MPSEPSPLLPHEEATLRHLTHPSQSVRIAMDRNWLARLFATLDAARAAAPRSGEGLTDDLTSAAIFMLNLVDQYYGTDHEFDIPEEEQFRYYRAVIEEAERAAPRSGEDRKALFDAGRATGTVEGWAEYTPHLVPDREALSDGERDCTIVLKWWQDLAMSQGRRAEKAEASAPRLGEGLVREDEWFYVAGHDGTYGPWMMSRDKTEWTLISESGAPAATRPEHELTPHERDSLDTYRSSTTLFLPPRLQENTE